MNIQKSKPESTPENRLDLLRIQLDNCDSELMRVLEKRMRLSREIGELKKRQGIGVYQKQRYEKLIIQRSAEAVSCGLDRDFVRQLFEIVHNESVRQQTEIAKNSLTE